MRSHPTVEAVDQRRTCVMEYTNTIDDHESTGPDAQFLKMLLVTIVHQYNVQCTLPRVYSTATHHVYGLKPVGAGRCTPGSDAREEEKEGFLQRTRVSAFISGTVTPI